MADTVKVKTIKPNEPTDIIWVGDKHHEADSKGNVHKNLAEKLVAAGKAYYPGSKRPDKKGGKDV